MVWPRKSINYVKNSKNRIGASDDDDDKTLVLQNERRRRGRVSL